MAVTLMDNPKFQPKTVAPALGVLLHPDFGASYFRPAIGLVRGSVMSSTTGSSSVAASPTNNPPSTSPQPPPPPQPSSNDNNNQNTNDNNGGTSSSLYLCVPITPSIETKHNADHPFLCCTESLIDLRSLLHYFFCS